MSLYFELFKKGENLVQLRFKMVQYAKKHGISSAARHFETTDMTVRKWLFRYNAGNKGSLKSKPKHVMTPGSTRFIILEKRRLAARQRKRLAQVVEKKRLQHLTD